MLLTREDLEQLEKIALAPYAVKSSTSKGREYKDLKDPYRLAFQRDRARIIHSHAFRRLREKTQVFVPGTGDHYRNRLTHTLEVAHISRDIARNLKLNEDLAESIALAHDLGHTPFGHAGEKKLDEIMKKFDERFEHNMQSKRIVEFLERKSPEYPGLNLCYETRDGLIKHRTTYDQPDNINLKSPGLEAQIVNLADSIAYTTHDIDDGLRSGILNIEKLLKVFIFELAYKEFPKNTDVLKYSTHIVSKLIKKMVRDLYLETEERINKMNIKTLEDVYNCKNDLVGFSPEYEKMHNELQSFLYKNLYYHDRVIKQSERGKNIIEFLFWHYYKNPPEKLTKKVTKDYPLHLVVKDYIAGMSDEYARKKSKIYLCPNG